VEDAALRGTGPYAKFKAMVDGFFGGLGFDKLFGKDGFYQDTMESRQQLLSIRQRTKDIFLNSSRAPIWEQKNIDRLYPDPDKFFRNPRTEAKKFNELRSALTDEWTYNNGIIKSSSDPKEVSTASKSNLEVNKLLTLLTPNVDNAHPTDIQEILNRTLTGQ